ncbi:MAG: aspartate kinase [Isosphaeraceae bacterium]|nr:aspartate kinase [Isosphaeraceae bacterium]
MPLLIQKFGGTSVADADKVLAAACRAIRAHRAGAKVVVVVSARGHTTDELIATAKQLSERPPARELDMLLSTGEQVSVALMAIAITAIGVPAISFTGAQIGLVTDSFHTKARIRNISTERMTQALDEGKIVIVAGFQGVDDNYDITTLGRGGSDTTAVALAAVLGADACEIYTDVDGVYTTDPRVVPAARKIDRISYDEMLELASLGAGVMHSRSIEFAKKYGVPIHVRTAFCDDPGTWIVGDIDARRLGYCVTGAALAKDEARVTVSGVPDRPGAVGELFRRVAEANIVVDMIVQNIAAAGTIKVSFTVASDDLEDTLRVTRAAADALGASTVSHDGSVSKVSVVGLGMRSHVGVAATMFEALARAGINIQMISTSEIKISVLVDRTVAASALRAVHEAFALDRPSNDSPVPFTPQVRRLPARPESAADDHAPRAVSPAGMEDLVISGVEYDDGQARVTIFDVIDQPGNAARIFRRIADAGIYVDMIVQNVSSAGSPNLSFTVRRGDAEGAARAAAEVVGHANIAVENEIANLSLVGVGMRTHTGVATRMFAALGARGIAVKLINTSEVSINVAIDLARGPEARDCLAEAFLQSIPAANGGAETAESSLPSLDATHPVR